jgi:hypothetical protein
MKIKRIMESFSRNVSDIPPASCIQHKKSKPSTTPQYSGKHSTKTSGNWYFSSTTDIATY